MYFRVAGGWVLAVWLSGETQRKPFTAFVWGELVWEESESYSSATTCQSFLIKNINRTNSWWDLHLWSLNIFFLRSLMQKYVLSCFICLAGLCSSEQGSRARWGGEARFQRVLQTAGAAGESGYVAMATVQGHHCERVSTHLQGKKHSLHRRSEIPTETNRLTSSPRVSVSG